MVRALGNEQVDLLAKDAVHAAPLVAHPDPRFADVVIFKDSFNSVILDMDQAATQHWWEQHRREGGARRTWLASLYPDMEDMDWKASTHLFQAPEVSSGTFIFATPPATQKWVARARARALATCSRLLKSRLASSPQCL